MSLRTSHFVPEYRNRENIGTANVLANREGGAFPAVPAILSRFGRRCSAVILALFCLAPLLQGAAPVGPTPKPAQIRTNPGPTIVGPTVRTNRTPFIAKPVPAKTNAAPAAAATTGKKAGSVLEQLKALPSKPAFYPAVVGAVCLVLVGVLVFRMARAKSGKGVRADQAAGPIPSISKGAKGKVAKVHICNVLQATPEARRLWQFDARGAGFNLGRQVTNLPSQGLPRSLVIKDWRSLFQRKLNVALLPQEHVFLRVVELPKSDFDETLSMVELQLEKLSPMPLTQIVWSLHILPHKSDNLQTVVLVIVARAIVEEFLGRLEGEGYMADRLELPVLDHLQATPINEDGAWIYPEAIGGKGTALVAWWYGGVLKNLDLVTLPSAAAPGDLKEQLVQMAWAGEMEGWITSSPQWHLVAEGSASGEWETALRSSLDQPLQIVAPLGAPELAARTATRVAASDPRATLVPPEFSLRYHQQFVDRLWIRGLAALGALYLVGVAIYFIALGYLGLQTGKVESKVAALSSDYTNAVQLKAQCQVLKDRQELKYAALDCWSLTAKLMPETLSLESMNFSDGKRLLLSGTAPSDQVGPLIEFEAAMRKATGPSGQPMFDPLKGDNLSYHANPGASTVSWNFALELKKVDLQ